MSIAAVFTASLWIFAAEASSASVPTAEEVLNRYAQSLTRFQRFSMTAHGKNHYRRVGQANEYLDSDKTYRVLRDNDRWNIVVSARTFPPAGKPGGYGNEFNYISNGHTLSVSYPQTKIGVRPPAPGAVNGSPIVNAKEQSRVINRFGQAAIAIGQCANVDTQYHLAQVFRLANPNLTGLRTGRDESGTFLESTNAVGDTLKLWIDYEAGGVLKRLLVVQAADASNANRFHHDRAMVEKVFGFAREAAIKSITYEVRHVETAPCEDQHVITKLEALRTVEALDGTTAHERYECQITDWNLSPDVASPTAFRPVLPVPENSRVFNPDEESILYAYRDGQVVLNINEPTVEELSTTKLPTRRSRAGGESQWAWMAVAGLFGFIWWRMRAVNASSPG